MRKKEVKREFNLMMSFPEKSFETLIAGAFKNQIKKKFFKDNVQIISISYGSDVENKINFQHL